MDTPDTNDSTPRLDDEERERSAEERNVVAPTPKEVREKADDHQEPQPKPTDPRKS
jgi:hypothetical protein